jgi:ubiquinone/menaquinone biosynthesis C-methylase UbiE
MPRKLDTPEVRLLAVLPEARGLGVGLLLMQECIERARRSGSAALTLHTTDMMRAAMRLYARMGFVAAPELDFHPAPGMTVKGFRLSLAEREVDLDAPEVVDLYDELPLWSAPFGLLLLSRVPLKRQLTILDVGAGTGFLTVELAQRCGPDAKVIAVDPWKAATARLRRKVQHLGLNNVTVLEQDAATIELPDASVDLVVSNLGINNFQNAAAVLRTCFRVSKPGARLLLTTNLVGHMAELYDVYRATLVQLGQEEQLAALDAHIAHRGTPGTVAHLLTDAGFQIRDTVTDSFPMRFADGSALLRHYFIRLGFVSGWKSVVAPEWRARVFAALEENLNARARERGELALTIPIALVDAVRP